MENPRHRNPKDMVDEYTRTLNLIENETIKTDKLANQFPQIEKEARDPATPDYAISKEAGNSFSAGVKADPEIAHASDLPHSFKHTVPESAKAQGTQTKGMTLNQKTHSPADGE